MSGSKDIEELAPSTSPDDGEIYLVGFWTDKGTCPLATGEFLKRLSREKGTAVRYLRYRRGSGVLRGR